MSSATPTQRARAYLRSGTGYTNAEIAAMCGLHEAYIRKVRQRDEGRDEAWQRWQDKNPSKVRSYRAKQDAARRVARAAR